MKTCKLCHRKHWAKGYCQSHYDIYAKPKYPCTIENCTKKATSKKSGLCAGHKWRLINKGTTDKTIPQYRPWNKNMTWIEENGIRIWKKNEND